MRIYIGYDAAEAEAYRVAVKSLAHHSDIEPEPLEVEKLTAHGLLNRPVDFRGQKYDLPSNAPCSTDFAASRFLVPMLCQRGWALFLDCDMLFLDDPLLVMEYADPDKAVIVVKHDHPGAEPDKMCGMAQTKYSRKNWSSVMLFNCDHPANRRLTLEDVNRRPGRDLHQFYWLNESEIGEMPREFNWLVNVQPEPESPVIAHYTLGGPWFHDWAPAPYDDLWLDVAHG